MDTQTVLEIIAMLDARLNTLDQLGCLHIRKGAFIKAQEYADRHYELKKFKIDLNKYIEPQVHEADYDQDMYDIMNEINEQDRLQADEESRLGQED